MVTNRAILIAVLSLMGSLATLGVASPEDDQVAGYLKSHNMLSLLEVQLIDRIEHAKDEDERSDLAQQLSELYIDQLRSFDSVDPYRQIVIERARSLTKRMGSIPMYELRIELIIDEYIGVEPNVELARLELLEPQQRDGAIAQLVEMNRELRRLVSQLDPEVAQLERLIARTNREVDPGINATLGDLRRYRSLAHYYHAWTGYSLAGLNDQHVPSDVFVSFGWLLGAEGEMPQFSLFNETTLEFEHVARAAIGVAMAYAQSEDALSGRSWSNFVAQSQYTELSSKLAAEDRLLQIMAMDRDWTDALRWMLTLEKQRDQSTLMCVGDARFMALRSLEAMQSSRVGRGGMSEAKKVARYAIEQLVDQNEIGHVLDLYRRFDSLPMVADSFITSYAQALRELAQAEQAGESGMYASVSALFAQALDAPDADRFPDERDDCALKLAYTEIRGGRASEAIKICEGMIRQSDKEEVIEEARWIRIAAIDSININAGRASSDSLEQAVREYILAYPSTARSARLLLRHAMQGTVDSQIAISTLTSIDDEDPIAIPARRTLVQLWYQQLRSSGFGDQELINEVLEIIRWIDQNRTNEVRDLSDARAQLGTIRIGLDLALRASPADLPFAEQLIIRGLGLISYDSSLAGFRSEFVYRQLEIAIINQRLGDARDLLGELETLDPQKAQSARLLMFNDSIRAWQSKRNMLNARRVVELGSDVLAWQTPVYPQPLGVQVSSIAELLADAADYLWSTSDDTQSRDLALRVSVLVLDRGQPSEPGLRRTASLAAQVNDYQHELDAWLLLLAAYPASDARWFEARYESLRVMRVVDPIRARSAYDQYKVLHPSLGPEPWNAMIASLFDDSVPLSVPLKEQSESGDSP